MSTRDNESKVTCQRMTPALRFRVRGEETAP
jgi:hypothetical protein